MVKMKKIFIVLILLIFILLYVPRITSSQYYYLSKKQRLNTIEKLSKNCLSSDITGLMVTYSKKYNDKNTTRCWRDFFQKCLYNKEHNLTLAIHVNCLIY